MRRFGDALIGFVVLSVFVYVACATSPERQVKLLPPVAPAVIYKTVKVPCMEPPPAMDEITWPTPGGDGNYFLHRTTAERIENALYERDRYIARMYRMCAEAAAR